MTRANSLQDIVNLRRHLIQTSITIIYTIAVTLGCSSEQVSVTLRLSSTKLISFVVMRRVLLQVCVRSAGRLVMFGPGSMASSTW